MVGCCVEPPPSLLCRSVAGPASAALHWPYGPGQTPRRPSPPREDRGTGEGIAQHGRAGMQNDVQSTRAPARPGHEGFLSEEQVPPTRYDDKGPTGNTAAETHTSSASTISCSP